MLYLLWGLLNLGLIIWFIIICFKATKLIREKIGIGAAIFFVVGLLSISAMHESGNNKVKFWNFVSPTDSATRYDNHNISVQLEKTLVSSYDLYIQYHTNEQTYTNIPVSASSTYEGCECGVVWKPDIANVTRTADTTKLKYVVSGVVDWNLFGITLYTQEKDYTGVASIKQGNF